MHLSAHTKYVNISETLMLKLLSITFQTRGSNRIRHIYAFEPHRVPQTSLAVKQFAFPTWDLSRTLQFFSLQTVSCTSSDIDGAIANLQRQLLQ